MPNWVHNSITIYGEKEALKSMADLLKAEYNGVENGSVNFLNLIAPPAGHWDEYSGVGVPGLSMEDKKAHPQYNWYDWNCSNWGTKWNACDPSVDMDGDSRLNISFDTAWSPPVPVINALAQRLTELKCTMQYTWEEEQGFGESWELDDLGHMYMTDEWDIPTSHADYEERGNICWCEAMDNDEKPFSDCPKELDTV